MGLDINAYQHLEFVKVVEDNTEWWYLSEEDGDLVRIFNCEPFADRAKPLIVNGVYRTDGKRIRFRAGSYSGYNEWREWLSRLALGVEPKVVWEHRPDSTFQGKPFVELIDFSDCEGYIGADASAKLAKDFAEWAGKAEAAAPDQWFLERYRDWRRAFELARVDGVVEFC